MLISDGGLWIFGGNVMEEKETLLQGTLERFPCLFLVFKLDIQIYSGENVDNVDSVNDRVDKFGEIALGLSLVRRFRFD